MKENRLNEWFGRNAGRHFVSLSCVQQRPDGDESVIVFSGFIAEIQGEWVYVTAGHILRMSPPLIMDEMYAAMGLDIIEESISEVEREFGYA